MPKVHKDRAIQVKRDDIAAGGSAFFFPKENPPVVVSARTLAEAEDILAANKGVISKEEVNQSI